MNARTMMLYAALTVAVVASFVLALGIGPAPVSLSRALASLRGDDASLAALVVQEIRLPRAILALLIGATLGLAGAALQGLLRNPLAEPGIIGVSGCAALAAVLAYYFGLYALFPLGLPAAGMAGALVAVVLINILAGRDSSVLTLILAGVAINALAGALTALALNLAPNPFAAYEMLSWLMGSLADRSFAHVWLATPFVLAGWVLLLSAGRALDALTLGDDAAASLGFDLRALRGRVIIGVALCVGASVAVSGVIGFVGLVVPHVFRPLVGHRPSRLLPVSMLGGALLVLAADIGVRVLGAGGELKLGVFTALVGAPFFLYLVIQTRRSMR